MDKRTWLLEVRKDPLIAKSRLQMANIFRKARAENPALARVLWRRSKLAEKIASDAIEKVLFRTEEGFPVESFLSLPG